MKYFESKTVVVKYDPALNAVCIHWKSEASSRTLRSAFNRAYEMLLRNRAANWVVDTQNLGRLNTNDLQWVSKVIPHAISQGLEKVAILLPPTLILKYPLESLKTAMLKNHLQVEDFIDKGSLEQWIQGAALPFQ